MNSIVQEGITMKHEWKKDGIIKMGIITLIQRKVPQINHTI